MTNEFGEDPTFYIYPLDHEEGTAFPDDFYERLERGLKSVGLGWDTT